MKDFVEKYFSTRPKKDTHWQQSLKNGEKNDFHQPKNSFPLAVISLSHREYFKNTGFHLISIIVSTTRKKVVSPFSLTVTF